ncbi:hypothetical protein BN14_10071 [Rhizoctonia solani AG-1 IB]|uniref:Uncharacterized protein n=1 Tax=Thanatephorus cucumeris (strain AG1-IB / isolate 7/3/14) TaxID=1108050 RepID=M5CA49_THACB|nr:hypothetical protein BN14_10071 [Rhizoctonia solani AG-1 IB]
MLPIQLDESYASLSSFTSQIEDCLGYREDKATRSLLDAQEQQLREFYEKELAIQREAETRARQHLQQSQLEYSTLRSQLQLQENIEQSEVVQALNDLNRIIDDIGRSISAYLVDDHVSRIFRKHPADITALNAVDLIALKSLIGHIENSSSLIVSSNGRGLQIECFFDYTIRDMICRFLEKAIFAPFHPAIGSALNKALRTTYEKLQKQVPQALAGKWRSDTFKNITDPTRRHYTTEQHTEALARKFNDGYIKPLINCVFGREINLKNNHYSRLHELIEMAWKWNSRLKGDVIMLGEFVQTRFSRLTSFDPALMDEFEASPRNPQPLRILGTLAFGLKSQRSIGGENPVEEIVSAMAMYF